MRENGRGYARDMDARTRKQQVEEEQGDPARIQVEANAKRDRLLAGLSLIVPAVLVQRS